LSQQGARETRHAGEHLARETFDNTESLQAILIRRLAQDGVHIGLATLKF
jgi:hypothetical protein